MSLIGTVIPVGLPFLMRSRNSPRGSSRSYLLVCCISRAGSLRNSSELPLLSYQGMSDEIPRSKTFLPAKGDGKRMTREAAPTSSIINLVRRTCSDFIELRRGKAFLGEDQLVSGFAALGHRSIGVLILCKNDHGSNNGVSIPN